MSQKHAKHSVASESHQQQHQTTTEQNSDYPWWYDARSWHCLDVCRMPNICLVKNVLLGYMKEVWRRGRRSKRWTDNITEWTRTPGRVWV